MSFRRTSTNLCFAAIWLLIGAISAYDGYLVVKFSDSIREYEQNPVCRYLIEYADGELSLFLRTKAAGTLVVLSVLAGLYRYRWRWALTTTGSVAIFQLGLLVYLVMF